ncbi:MAG: FAD:protein FMN transferase [Flammeovirgaceae bacterium]
MCKFYIKDGKRFAHTIDPTTGYPVEHSLLSASVFANDCTTADAFATAFMVMGKEKAIELLNAYPDLDAFLVYDEGGETKTYLTAGAKKWKADPQQ